MLTVFVATSAVVCLLLLRIYKIGRIELTINSYKPAWHVSDERQPFFFFGAPIIFLFSISFLLLLSIHIHTYHIPIHTQRIQLILTTENRFASATKEFHLIGENAQPYNAFSKPKTNDLIYFFFLFSVVSVTSSSATIPNRSISAMVTASTIFITMGMAFFQCIMTIVQS